MRPTNSPSSTRTTGLRLLGLSALLAFAMPARSDAIHRRDLPVIRGLARDLEIQTRRVRRAAEDQVGRLNFRERQMLQSLRRMEISANRFHTLVTDYFVSPSMATRELEQLNRDADRVETAIFHSHPMRFVIRDWNRANRTLRSINDYFYRRQFSDTSFDGRRIRTYERTYRVRRF